MSELFVYDNNTGDSLVREMNKTEIANKEKVVNERQARLSAIEEKAIAREEIFKRLGLTADEAAILLG